MHQPWDALTAPRFTGPRTYARLPYLQDLGVTGLWLTPIFVSPSNHRYDITDYRHVDPHLGGDAAWDELVRESTKAGIRIVLDGVFNHVGNENALFRAALETAVLPRIAA